MDLRTEDELMLNKTLSKTAEKIRKNRKNSNKIVKEIQEFQEIKELLNISDVLEEEEEVGEDVGVETCDSIVSYPTPITAPGIEIFQEENVFWLFNEETLCLGDFLADNERFNIFGKDGEVPKDLFQDLIAHHITETILPDNEKCHSVSLYVLYLMSVHTDKNFVIACSDFLKYRKFEVSAGEILPIFFNFGTSSRLLIASEFPVELPRNIDRSPRAGTRTGGNGFPYYNVEMVGNIILHYAALDLIKREPNAKLLLKAFTRLTLDWKIRSSRLFSVYSSLLSILSSQFVETLGIDNVVSCLHLEEEHFLNQVEIARAVLMPVSSTLHKALIIRTINFLLKSQILKIFDSLKVQDVIKVLKKLKRKGLTPLEVYCILQLINGSLPSVTARAKQVGDINSALISLEAGFFNVKDSVDVIRLKLEIAKLRNLVSNNADNALSTGYLNLSQLGKRK